VSQQNENKIVSLILLTTLFMWLFRTFPRLFFGCVLCVHFVCVVGPVDRKVCPFFFVLSFFFGGDFFFNSFLCFERKQRERERDKMSDKPDQMSWEGWIDRYVFDIVSLSFSLLKHKN
jgi:hypothetical protein